LSETNIPVLDLQPEIDLLWDELNAAFQNVLRSGQFIMGGAVPELEASIAAYLGVKHAVALNSGTDALTIGLRALGIEPGDEVITTTFSFFASAESVSLIGAHPVFADIDSASFNLDPAAVEAAITPRTKAIIPVHLFGQAADLAPLRDLADRHGLKLLEDMAQAFGGAYRGRKLGTWGEAAALSFFPSKNLGAYGDAGMLVTNDDAAAEMARKLRAHGSLKKYHNEILGYNSRMDTLQAAILSVKLPHVDEWNAARRAAAARYNALLADVPGIITPCERPDAHHVYHQYTVRVLNGQRDAVQKQMAEAGIATMVYYPVPLHRLPFYAERGEHYPQAEAAAAEVLSLPMWPQITPEVQARVASALRAAVG
jgi:dTDP-4-amino-4,6-dideoxygalactose transaminase